MIAFAGIATAFAASTSYVSLRYGGTVKGVGVGVYQDSSFTQPISSIDVGTVDPGTIRNGTLHIRNDGLTPVRLTPQILNWNPSDASNFVSLMWSYNGQSIGVGNAAEVVFMLSISPNIHEIATFSFDAIISDA